MSDERDSAVGDGGDADVTDDTRGQTAVVTHPLRPTGKRSRRGAVEDTDTESKPETDASGGKNGNGSTPKTSRKQSGPGRSARNPLAFVWTYLKQVVAELRKVIWPNRKQMVSYTTVVLVFLAFMVTLIGLVDLGLAKLVMFVFG
ncbi:MAG: preprotein translocase, SecE subunit [Mycobacterium sp.]|nr:preprotein translocase, SecE subunit [Mycobacterium sp.]